MDRVVKGSSSNKEVGGLTSYNGNTTQGDSNSQCVDSIISLKNKKSPTYGVGGPYMGCDYKGDDTPRSERSEEEAD